MALQVVGRRSWTVAEESIFRINEFIGVFDDATIEWCSNFMEEFDIMKKLAIALSIFPGGLLVIALLSYVICSIAERNLPPGGANIGLGLLFLAAVVNVPTLLSWILFFARKRGESTETRRP